MWYHCLSLLIAPGGNPVGKDREEMISITSTIVMMLVFSWKQRRGSFYFHSIQKVITPPYKTYLNNESRRTERERWSGATNHSLSSNSKVEVFHFFIWWLASQMINCCWFMPNPKLNTDISVHLAYQYMIALTFTQRRAGKCELWFNMTIPALHTSEIKSSRVLDQY